MRTHTDPRLDNLEFEIKYRLREIILEHGGLISVDHPKVRRLFQSLSGIRKYREVAYEGHCQRLCA